MSSSLKELITGIRSCKTAAEERAYVAKECSNIRESFKNDEKTRRDRNVAKLMFMQMMGYPTSFGQMECLKLISSKSFSDKRIGYLALAQLMDESSDVLMLATHTVKQDLKDNDQYVVGLALTALCNLATDEMCRAVIMDIPDLLAQGPFIRRKTASLMLRCVRRCGPDVVEEFASRVKALVEDRNHGVALAGCALASAMAEVDPEGMRECLTALVPSLARRLKEMTLGGGVSSGEYDVYAVTDPFLQCKVIRLIRLACQDDADATEQVGDVLAQVVTNTDATKNSGICVLLEVAHCIAALRQADAGLVVLASNILGKFLSNTRDPNLRYVGMQALKTLVAEAGSLSDEAAADLQKKRPLVLQCLKEADPAVRHVALEVVCQLMDKHNVKSSVRELLNILLDADDSFKPLLVSKLWAASVAHHDPKTELRWLVDTLVRIMSLAGNFITYAQMDLLLALLVSAPSDVQAYAGAKLLFAARESLSQEGLVQCSVWALGEFADLLVASSEGMESGVKLGPAELVAFLKTVETRPAHASLPKVADAALGQAPPMFLSGQLGEDPTAATATSSVNLNPDVSVFGLPSPVEMGVRTRRLLVTAWSKLPARLPSGSCPVEQVLTHGLEKYRNDPDAETQQRAVQFACLLQSYLLQPLGSEALSHLPPVEAPLLEARRKEALMEAGATPLTSRSGVSRPRPATKLASGKKTAANLLDVSDEEEEVVAPVQAIAPTSIPPKPSDLLTDLFGSSAATQPAAAPPVDLASILSGSAAQPASTKPSSGLDLLDILGTGSAAPVKTSDPLLHLFGPSASPAAPATAAKVGLDDLLAGFGAPSTTALRSTTGSLSIYKKHGLEVTLHFPLGGIRVSAGGEVTVEARVRNEDSVSGVGEIKIEVAPPKHLAVRLETASGAQLPPSGSGGLVTQRIHVRKVADFPTGASTFALRCRLTFKRQGGNLVQELADAAFPEGV